VRNLQIGDLSPAERDKLVRCRQFQHFGGIMVVLHEGGQKGIYQDRQAGLLADKRHDRPSGRVGFQRRNLHSYVSEGGAV
jgi:hypothetical protein